MHWRGSFSSLSLSSRALITLSLTTLALITLPCSNHRCLTALSPWLCNLGSMEVWIGSNGSTTSLHWDSYVIDYMFVASGKKRIVVIPPSAHTHNCTSFHGTFFPGVDALTEIPDFAQVVELTAGEGFSILLGPWLLNYWCFTPRNYWFTGPARGWAVIS